MPKLPEPYAPTYSLPLKNLFKNGICSRFRPSSSPPWPRTSSDHPSLPESALLLASESEYEILGRANPEDGRFFKLKKVSYSFAAMEAGPPTTRRFDSRTAPPGAVTHNTNDAVVAVAAVWVVVADAAGVGTQTQNTLMQVPRRGWGKFKEGKVLVSCKSEKIFAFWLRAETPVCGPKRPFVFTSLLAIHGFTATTTTKNTTGHHQDAAAVHCFIAFSF